MKWTRYIAVLFSVTLTTQTHASSWSWTVGCPESGATGPLSSFSANLSTTFSGSGSCERVSSRFSKFSFSSYSGGTLNATNVFGLHTGDVLIMPPILNTETKPVFSVDPACPATTKDLNWIFAQWGAAERPNFTTLPLIGTATYSTSSGISITSAYTINGTEMFTGSIGLAGSCSNGLYTLSGSGDRGVITESLYGIRSQPQIRPRPILCWASPIQLPPPPTMAAYRDKV